MKLNQIIAVVSGKKSRATAVLTDAHRWKPEQLVGLSKTYRPKEEGGELLPSEKKSVQARVAPIVKEVVNELADFYDAVATQETGNTVAKTDVTVDGVTVLKSVPVSVLLFLEKQLVDLNTFVSGIPTLPTDQEWKYDTNADCFVTDPVETVRNKKIAKAFVKYEATKEHPAQVDVVNVDELVGYWSTKLFSGAIPVLKKSQMQEKVRKLLLAVKVAREAANGTEVSQVKIGQDVLGYIFNELIDK